MKRSFYFMANTKNNNTNKSKTKNTKSKEQKNIEKTIKKMHPMTLIIGIVFLIMGVAIGYFTSFYLTKNDVFDVLGDKNVVVEVGSSGVYTDQGVKCISYGRDLSSDVVIDTNMTKNDDGTYTFDTTKEGEFYIIYTVDDVKYKGIQRVRVITVGGTHE